MPGQVSNNGLPAAPAGINDQEHGTVLSTSGIRIPPFNQTALSFLVPLLALPQITHYILDGFIWKIRHDDFKWNSELKSV